MKVYAQNKQEADTIYQKIAQAFVQYQVTATPTNYAVWYEYFVSDNPAYKQQLEAALQQEGYSNLLGTRLYESFLKTKQANTAELEKAFRIFLDRMINRIMDWSKSMETHTAALDKCVTDLSQDNNMDQSKLASLTQDILSTTRSIATSQSEIHQELSSANTRIQQLQQELTAVKEEALTDALTKLPNRRAFEHKVAELMATTKQNEQLFLILYDIDHFKRFNDTYGHLIGDAVLRFLSNIAQQVIEPSHMLARVGGEEFAVLVPMASADQAFFLAEKLRKKIAASQLKRKDTGETISNIHISLGVTSYRLEEHWEKWYQRADEALYQSKNTGRNRTTLV